MFDVQDIKTIITQIENEKGLSRDTSIHAVETALAAAYKREYGKTGQEIRVRFNMDTGEADFFQVKEVIGTIEEHENNEKTFNEERHILLDDASRLKNNVSVGDEITFPLERKTEFGRIAAQSAKQALAFYFRNAEKKAVTDEFIGSKGSIVTGNVRRFERGNLYIDLGKTVAVMPFYEQIRRERFRIGDKVRALIISVDEKAHHGSFITLSRSHPDFVKKLFEQESTELANESIEIKKVVREPGVQTKIAVVSNTEGLDPIGALVGQRGVRVLMVRNELQGEQIDIFEWSDDPSVFLERAMSPAHVVSVSDESSERVKIVVTNENLSVVIGRGGQNIKMVSKLIEKDLDVELNSGEKIVSITNGEVFIHKNTSPVQNDNKQESVEDSNDSQVSMESETQDEVSEEISNTEQEETSEDKKEEMSEEADAPDESTDDENTDDRDTDSQKQTESI